MLPGHLRFRAALTGGSDWAFIWGQRFLVALPTSTPRTSIDSFLALTGETDISIESLVSLVPVGEDAFAVVVLDLSAEAGADELSITSVVRGSVAVDVFSVGGWRRFTDQGARPWMLADFRSVTAVVIGGTEIPMVALAKSQRDSAPADGPLERAQQLVWSLEPRVDTVIPAVFPSPEDETIIRPRSLSNAQTSHGQPHTNDPPVLEYSPDLEMDDADDTVLVALGFRTPRNDNTSETPYTHDSLPAAARAPAAQAPADRAPADSPEQVRSARIPSDRPASFYRFRVGSSDAIPLAADAYVGRKPKSPRISTTVPHLVTVASPRREVSGTHVRIAQEGNSVVVTDLGSMNGTIVSIPGARAVRLRQSESVVVTPGTRLDIGDGNIIEILSIAP